MNTEKKKLIQNKIGSKPFIIVLMILLFLIPINLIKSIITDRKYYQEDAIESILKPKGGEPNLEGFAIALPYTKNVEQIDKNNKVNFIEKTFYLIASPENLNIKSDINPEYLNRGIFSVPVFSSSFEIKGSFNAMEISHTEIPVNSIQWKKAILLLGIKDKKTISETPELYINDEILNISLTEPQECSPFSNTILFDLPPPYYY